MSDSETLAAIRGVVASGDPRRTRVRREGWAQIRQILGLDAVKAEDSEETDEKPPVAGPGSSAKAWRSYAESHGVEVVEDATKADIIAAVEAAEADSDGGGEEVDETDDESGGSEESEETDEN